MDRQTLKKELLKHALKQYGTEPEYLWAKFPQYAVLRRRDNRKWYAVFMDVSGEKLGLTEDVIVPVINMKAEPVLVGSLRMEKGFLPAYHMNKENWITVLLDGTVDLERITALLDMSFAMAGGKKNGK